MTYCRGNVAVLEARQENTCLFVAVGQLVTKFAHFETLPIFHQSNLPSYRIIIDL